MSSSTWFFSIPGICRTGRTSSLSDLRLWMVRGGTRRAAPMWAAGQEALHRVQDPHPGGLSQLLRCTSWSPLLRSEHTSLLLCFWLHSRCPAGYFDRGPCSPMSSSCPRPVFLSEDPVLPQLAPAHHPQAGGSPAAVLGVGEVLLSPMNHKPSTVLLARSVRPASFLTGRICQRSLVLHRCEVGVHGMKTHSTMGAVGAPTRCGGAGG